MSAAGGNGAGTRGVLHGAHVLVGVTGSIAAYKAAALVSELVQHGARVDVILTAAGARFVTAATFTALTPGAVCTDMFAPLEGATGRIPHVELADRADLIVIAPASAHTMARLAHGLADDLLSLTVLASRAPLLVAPAMEAQMWQHPATQRNAELLRRDGATIAGPATGHHASGAGGLGRMLEPADLVGHIRLLLGGAGDLAGRRCLITAGGTREPLDPVRVLGNRSSGKMGVALARAARDRGAAVTLITTATVPADAAGISVEQVESAAEMHAAVTAHLAEHDVLLMAAAVADYRPAAVAPQKIKKARTGSEHHLELERTADIVASAAASGSDRPQVIVAFAAETEQLEEFARAKLESKRVDLIVANPVTSEGGGSVFGSDQNEVLLISREAPTVRLPQMAKEQAAHHILDAISRRLGSRANRQR